MTTAATVDYCSSSPCQHQSTCTNTPDGLGYRCSCKPGFNGDNCEMNIDECASNPCNEGTCEDLVDDYKCDCTGTGNIGKNCDNITDECSTSPCKNGGTCTDKKDDYSCSCVPGFIGNDCDINEDNCAGAAMPIAARI